MTHPIPTEFVAADPTPEPPDPFILQVWSGKNWVLQGGKSEGGFGYWLDHVYPGSPFRILRVPDHPADASKMVATPAAVSERHPVPFKVSCEVHRYYEMPAFAAYLAGSVHDGKPIIALNIDAMLHSINGGDMKPGELAECVATGIVHEVLHVVEDWAKSDFSEQFVEGIMAAAQGLSEEATAEMQKHAAESQRVQEIANAERRVIALAEKFRDRRKGAIVEPMEVLDEIDDAVDAMRAARKEQG